MFRKTLSEYLLKVSSIKNTQIILKRFKFARGATWLFLALSILLLVYTYHRAEFIYDGKGYEKYFKYYVISLAGVLFWGTVLRLKDEIKLKVTMAATSLVVGIYLVEITLHFLDLSKKPSYADRAAKLAAKDGIEFDMRTKLQVVKQLQRDGIDAVPMFCLIWSTKRMGFRVQNLCFLLAELPINIQCRVTRTENMLSI